MKKIHISLFISTFLLMGMATACIPSDPGYTYKCKKGVIKFVEADIAGDVEIYSSNYVCGVSLEYKTGYIHASNGSFLTIETYTSDGSRLTMPVQCSWLPSENRSNFPEYDINECGYENPDYVVIYCNENDELTISDKTCAEYMDTPEGEFIP